MADDTKTVLDQLGQAESLAFTSRDVFVPVVKQILNLVNNPNIEIQRWCARFLKKAFSSGDDYVSSGEKIDLAIDALIPVMSLAQVKDIQVWKNVIDLSVVLFRLVFRYVADNDGCHSIWTNLNDLKNLIVSRYESQFPFEQSFESERDAMRNIECKLEVLKFIITVIDYQSRSSSTRYFSLSRVNPNHTLIKYGPLEVESNNLLTRVLKPLSDEIIVAPIVTATLNHLAVLMRRKRQYGEKIMASLDQFDSTRKSQSNYESLETFKLSKKYADRSLRVLLTYAVKCQLVPPKFQNAINRKIATLTNRGDEIRKKNILLPSAEDQNIRKRKFEGFENANKKLKTLDFKHLYALTDVNSELNNFDLSTLPQNILVSMALTALNKADVRKLNKALEIVSDRYVDAVKESSTLKQEPGASAEEDGKTEMEKSETDEGENFDPNAKYTLPPPTRLSFEEKREQVKLIIQNFFDLAKVAEDQEIQADPESDSKAELRKVAISSWKPDSWLLLLTRLATRGMNTIEGDEKQSPDVAVNEELSDLIRQALFDYFLADIHDRVDAVIEWLNEEWYSERVSSEEKLRQTLEKELSEKYEQDPDNRGNIDKELEEKLDAAELETPKYNKWAQRVLDSMITFLEPSDRKIFLRMLSDLPYLNKDMLEGIKSLCADPARAKLGFLSLQFLVMYRPPVKDACIQVLQELKTSDQEDLKEEAQKLLTKYGVE